jgi:hypothetical protein
MARARSKRAQRKRREPADWQELHSPTVEIAIDDPEATRKTRRNLTRVRQSEVWRHNRLSGMQRDAEKEMEFAWRMRTAGLGAAVSGFNVKHGKATSADFGARIEEVWLPWTTLAHARRILLAAVIDCLAEPKTLAQVERDHRMRRGQAFDNYVRALDLWCEIRGWVRGPAMAGGPHLTPEGPTRA